MGWYRCLDTMERDDRRLQRLLREVRPRLCPGARARVAHVHVYPSRGCTYTLDKRRIFVRMDDAEGRPLDDCALRHVLLHELAHVLNRGGTGHDRPVPAGPRHGPPPSARFWAALARLQRCFGRAPAQCPHGVPSGYNRECAEGMGVSSPR